MTAVQDWVRPWFPAGMTGHVDAKCPDLLKHVPEPAEGSGWLNPRQGLICDACIPSWDATCSTCEASLAGDDMAGVDPPFTEADAQAWQDKHVCYPVVVVVPPAKPAPPPAGVVLLPLF